MSSTAIEPCYYAAVDLGGSPATPRAIAVVRRVEPPRPVPEGEKLKPDDAPRSVEWQKRRGVEKTKLDRDDQSSRDMGRSLRHLAEPA